MTAPVEPAPVPEDDDAFIVTLENAADQPARLTPYQIASLLLGAANRLRRIHASREAEIEAARRSGIEEAAALIQRHSRSLAEDVRALDQRPDTEKADGA